MQCTVHIYIPGVPYCSANSCLKTLPGVTLMKCWAQSELSWISVGSEREKKKDRQTEDKQTDRETDKQNERKNCNENIIIPVL